ncbi:hypothetical protein HV782_013665 [Pseudomonas monsensis]|uniref:hypothetical protein n=1 Tax=Pseudomonas monsensis TaxID=2745509 RepID=UPI001648E76F|nr:hypothetical protein [Pseudomonas monsensis]QXI02973.1 hypothetical protein HV782_013665 [Pseudomonas monsensis]
MDTPNVKGSDDRLSAKYVELLKAAGFEIIAVHDEIVFFKLIGYAYSISFQTNTPEYLSFSLGASIDDEKVKDVEHRYACVQYVNSKLKYVKCHFETDEEDGDSVHFVCDLMFLNETDFTRCAHTAVKALDNAYISVSAKFPDVV